MGSRRCSLPSFVSSSSYGSNIDESPWRFSWTERSISRTTTTIAMVCTSTITTLRICCATAELTNGAMPDRTLHSKLVTIEMGGMMVTIEMGGMMAVKDVVSLFQSTASILSAAMVGTG